MPQHVWSALPGDTIRDVMTLGVWVLQSSLKSVRTGLTGRSLRLGAAWVLQGWLLGSQGRPGAGCSRGPSPASGVEPESLRGGSRGAKGLGPAGALRRKDPGTCSLPPQSFTACVGQQSAKSPGKPGQIFWEHYLHGSFLSLGSLLCKFQWLQSAKLLGHVSRLGCGHLPVSLSEEAASGRRPRGWKLRNVSSLGNPCPHHCSPVSGLTARFSHPVFYSGLTLSGTRCTHYSCGAEVGGFFHLVFIYLCEHFIHGHGPCFLYLYIQHSTMYRTLRRMNVQEACRLESGEPHVLPAVHFPSPRGQCQLS